MSDLYAIGSTLSKGRTSKGGNVRVTGTTDGAIYTVDYVLNMAMEGRLVGVSLGTITTPITFKAYDADQPELVIDVPSGTTIIPVHIDVYLEDSAGTDNEIIAITATNNVGAGTSTAITPLSTRTSRPATTGCSVYSAYAGNGTAPAGTQEFWRAGNAFADANTQPPRLFSWDVRHDVPVVITGTGALVMYISATTTQAAGFIKASWIELASTEL